MFTSSRSALKPEPTQITRQESWRREYTSNPYLRSLSNEQVLVHGSKIVEGIRPYFITGGPGEVPNKVILLLQKFTHFNEEANYRGLDLRKMPKNHRQL